ncbi:FAD-dependent oxidoreductase [Maribellus maritimus]|uniref:FAD-dependent oxidoreductase n=1 Tax=Maribellus maritimus TaxID=2870838 RepID=UPI001EEBD39D|nr:FAD-dependent oxidoreductase [Maribellus maritimus]MCG6186570.1 FAD-dependent oxidoreductase [Maribellus maritimus]
MKRRDFVTRIIVAGSALSMGVSCGRKIEGDQQETPAPLSEATEPQRTITEPAREIPVIAETDVLVIGGGPAGVAAAIAASRAGAETYLVERYNHLGGLWTGGLVLPLLSTHAVDKQKRRKQVIYGLGGEMAQRLFDMEMAIHEVNPIIDPEAGKYILDEMIVESGVKMLYHSWGVNAIMEGNTIKGVFIESKSGRQAVLAKVVIDCTGDGDVFHWAGDSYETMNYHIGLVHRLGNIDRIDKNKPGYKKMPLGQPTPIPSVNWVNMHGLNDQDGIDMQNLSQLQLQYRKEIWESVERIKKVPGHENVFLLDTASQMGVRMSRIVEGEYKLTLEDTMTFKQFDDVIGISGAWTSMLYKGNKVLAYERPLWQIPYRSLLPKKTENLLVAGRCFCFEQALVEDTRIIGTCLITGHGAGAAAAIAANDRVTVREIDRQKLRKTLEEQNVWFG